MQSINQSLDSRMEGGETGRIRGRKFKGGRDSIYVVCSVQQLASDSRAELNLEQMMDEYYSLYDNDRPQTGPFLLESSREEEGKGHDSTSQTGHKVRGDVGGTRVQTVTTRTHSAKVKPKGKEDGVDLEGAEGEEEGVEEDGVDLVGATSAIKTEQYREKEGAEGKEDGVEEEGAEGEEWKAKNIGTVFGVTDDLVTLGDGKEYYFFKLPHKVHLQQSR